MPIDGKGRFHLNSQLASSSNKLQGDAGAYSGSKVAEPAEKNEAPGGVHEHLKAMHAEMGGKHMHVHHDGISHTTHQVGEDGEVQGPHDHENLEAVKQHLGKFFDEEENEGGEGYGKADGAGKKDHSSLYV